MRRSNFLKKIGKRVQKKATLAATCMVHEALWGEEPKGKGRGYGKKKQNVAKRNSREVE